MRNLLKVEVWSIRAGDDSLEETCELLACDSIAQALVVASYSDGSAEHRYYCAKDEALGLSTLRRRQPSEGFFDYREANREPAVVVVAAARRAR